MEYVNISVSRGHWKELSEKKEVPSPRSGHSATIYTNAMYVFGGHNGSKVLNELYKFDLLKCEWEKLSDKSPPNTLPSPRTSHSAAIDPISGVLYVHGGSGNDFGSSNKSDLFSYSIRDNAWEKITPQGSGPEARYGHSMNVYKSSLYVFGGTIGISYLNDLYLFELETHTWIQLNIKQNIPKPRYKHSCKIIKDKLLIIGGAEYKNTLKDIWEIDLATLDCRNLNVPELGFIGRHTHSSEMYKNDVFVLGESSMQQQLSSLWKFSLKSFKWKEMVQLGTRPPSMCFHTMVLCEGYLVVFGGNIKDVRTNKVFVYRLSVYFPEPESPISRLCALSNKPGVHSDIKIRSKTSEYYTQSIIIHIRVPLLFQYINNEKSIPLNYPDSTVQALMIYIYKDTVDPLLPLEDMLNLFSISGIYGIPPLLNRICSLICRSITTRSLKVIANYIASNSDQKLFHRNEFRQNVDNYHSNTPLDDLLKKYINDCLELTSGEKVYWACISHLTKLDNLNGVQDLVKHDVLRLKNKNNGKNFSQKTAIGYQETNLDWCLSLLYQTEKNFSLYSQGNLIKVHDFVLISNSEYFENYFNTPDSNKIQAVVDIPLEYIENIVKYMYLGVSGIQDLSPEFQSHLIPYADYLQLTNRYLFDYIGSMINDILDNSNAFELLISAYRMKATVMKHLVLEYFIQNYKELVEMDEIYQLPVDLLVELHRWKASSIS